MPDICRWRYDDYHDLWTTDCNQEFVVIDSTPKDNGMNFCPFCGGSLHQVPVREDVEHANM